MDIDETAGQGVLLGLACGDALGRPVEFKSPRRIERDHGQVTEMLANGTYGKPAGTITDDTEMALCIARSLVEHDAFCPADIAQRFVEWYESGPFDIGNLTRDVLQQIKQGVSWENIGYQTWETLPEGSNAGNGSVMRCAPYAIAYADDLNRLDQISRLSSAITHADPRCTSGCAVLNCTIAGLLSGETNPLAHALELLDDDIPAELMTALEPITDGRRPDLLSSSGYVVHTLQTALYYGLAAESAEDALVTVVNMGDDADTVGAVTGAIVGARFGAESLPERWTTALDCEPELGTLGRLLAAGDFDAQLPADG